MTRSPFFATLFSVKQLLCMFCMCAEKDIFALHGLRQRPQRGRNGFLRRERFSLSLLNPTFPAHWSCQWLGKLVPSYASALKTIQKQKLFGLEMRKQKARTSDSSYISTRDINFQCCLIIYSCRGTVTMFSWKKERYKTENGKFEGGHENKKKYLDL